jgi:tRNA (guanine-N7-)-methyltransferase
MSAVHLRKVRSFVRRPGRLTAAQRRALEELLPRFGPAASSGVLDLVALFGRDAPRILDVGFGDGEAIVTSAANYAQLDYLGVEVHEPGIGHLLLLLERTGLTNVRVIARDAADVIPEMLGDASFAAVNLFFPDPWPKKRHHKRRLLQPPFLEEILRVLAPNGLLHFATDWTDYAEQARELLDREPRLAPLPPDEVREDPLAFRPPTKFERRGRRLGHDVVDLFYAKRGSTAPSPESAI